MLNPLPQNRLIAKAAFRHAVQSIWQYRRVGLALALPWMIILALLDFFIVKQLSVQDRLGANLLQILLSVVSTFIVAAVSVKWHRFVLRDETAGGLASLTVNGRLLRYYLRLLGAGLIVLALLLLPVALLQFLIPLKLLVVLLVVPVYAATLGLSIGLPAIAIDETAISYRASLALAWQHWGQMLIYSMLLLLMAFAAVFVQEFVMRIAGSIGTEFARAAFPFIAIPFNAFSALLMASAITTLYGILIEGRRV